MWWSHHKWVEPIDSKEEDKFIGKKYQSRQPILILEKEFSDSGEKL